MHIMLLTLHARRKARLARNDPALGTVECVVIARVTTLEDLYELRDKLADMKQRYDELARAEEEKQVTSAVQRPTGSATALHQRLSIDLYTSFEGASFNQEGKTPISDKSFNALAAVVRDVVLETSGRWHFLPVIELPAKWVVSCESGVLLNPDGKNDNWQSLDYQGHLLSAFNRQIKDVLDQELPSVASPSQVIHLQTINNRVNSDHLSDFNTRGFHFGEYSELLSGDGREMLKCDSIQVYEEREDKAFRGLMKYMLATECHVTTWWPIRGSSLRYIDSKYVDKWQHDLSQAVKRHRNKASADRYLAVAVERRNGRFEASLHDESLLLRQDGSSVRTGIRYDQLVECIIGKYFWDMIGKNGFHLYIVPVELNNDDQTRNEYLRHLMASNLGVDEQLDRMKNQFFLDWIMIERRYPQTLILQWDNRLEICKCTAWPKEIEEKCRIAGDYEDLGLLEHRYALSEQLPPSSCSKRDACPFDNDSPISPICCLRRAFKEATGTLSPVELGGGNQAMLPEICERIEQRKHGFYKQEWPLLISNLQARGN